MTNSFCCPGFKAAGIHAGIKKNNAKDLGMIYTEHPAAAAAVFTRNQVVAAPVVVSKANIRDGTARAVIVNSGNANCCTGAGGRADAEKMTRLVAAQMDIAAHQVQVASTGVIGAPLPMDKVRAAVPDLTRKLDEQGFADLAEAIMTTDTVPKIARRRGELGGHPYTLLAVAKGAGMIRPDMATMLCFICTDLTATSAQLRQALTRAVDGSFNRITIDGDTSTNDTVLLMASGQSRAELNSATQAAFQPVLNDLLVELAKAMVRDGEGVTKLVEVVVRGAASDADAQVVADTIAHSPLVKTAFFGQDANWGRILAAAGRAGVALDAGRIDLFFNDVQMVAAGAGCGPEAEAAATKVLHTPEFTVTVELNAGPGRASMWTCDLSLDYVKINADYRT